MATELPRGSAGTAAWTALREGLAPGHGAAARSRSSRRLGLWTKRVLDVSVSATFLLLFAPALALIAVAISLDSPGHPFYVDLRCGKDGRRFWMIKFRTMHRGASALKPNLSALNEAEPPLFKIKEDPRVTRLGRVLRRWSLDEVPQLANVLIGQMSLVGPRPFVVGEADALSAQAETRELMRPGMSGPWQVSGRVQLSTDELIELDKDYVENWVLWRDLVLLVRTVRAVLGGHGAY